MLGMGKEGESEMNNEILNKLIELGYVKTLVNSLEYTLYLDADGNGCFLSEFAPTKCAADAEIIKRALFDECGKRGIEISILHGRMALRDYAYIYDDDTSRESFVAAFCKVVGI
jgi:hypothetical protein